MSEKLGVCSKILNTFKTIGGGILMLIAFIVVGGNECREIDEVEESENTPMEVKRFKVTLKNSTGNISNTILHCCSNSDKISYLRLFRYGTMERRINGYGESATIYPVLILDEQIASQLRSNYKIWEYNNEVLYGPSISERLPLGEIYSIPKNGLYLSRLHGKPLLITEVEQLS